MSDPAAVPRNLDELAGEGAAAEALAALRSAGGDRVGPMERHCLRCYVIAGEVARRQGWDIDEEVLLVAAIMHDSGLYGEISSGGVYVRDGADAARRIVANHGWDEDRIRRCTDAIDRHHDVRSQLERGTEVEALRRADQTEVTGGLIAIGVPRAWVRRLRREVPASGMYREIGRLVWRVLLDRPLTLPRIFLR